MCAKFYDLNGDEYVDIMVKEFVKGFKVYLNDKKGNFFEHSFLQKEDIDRRHIVFSDIDNDGDADVIYSTYYRDRNYSGGVLLNNGSGIFTDSGQRLPKAKYGRLGTGDLNNDGYTDVIFTDWENPSQIWLNNGKGVLVDTGIRLGEGDGNGWLGCTIKDLDNDGDLDVFINNRRNGNHGLWFNQLIADNH